MSGGAGAGADDRIERQCSYCGGWSAACDRHYDRRKGTMMSRCYECDRRAFDAQMAVVIVVLVLVAALVCAAIGAWGGRGGLG